MGDLLGIRILSKAETFQFLRLLGNLDPDIAAAERLKYHSHLDYYLPSLPLAFTRDGLRLGDARLEVLSVKEPPSSTFPNVLRDLLRLETNFILCSEFKRVLNDKAITIIRTAQNHFHWSQWVADLPSILSMILNRGNRENVIADKTALHDVEDLDRTLARIKNDGEYLGEFSLTVVLYGWGEQARLQTAAADVVKIFGNHEASLIRETYNALNAYLSIIPGNQAFNLRRTWLLSGNYADLSFLYAPSAGEKTNRHLGGEHLVVLETNDATPFYFNLYEHDRLGALLFGASGAGKSILANLLIDHSQKDAPYTFILDLGGSYRQITRKHGGSYVQMRFSAKGSGAEGQFFRINPFVLPPTPDNLQFLFTFVRLLLTNSGYAPSVEDDRELFEAVEAMYVFAPNQRTLGNLVHGLPPHLGPVLRPWKGDGQYGSVFDNEQDTLTFARFQTFDFQEMDELYPQVLEPLLFYVFQRISQVVYDPALVRYPKQLWADEVWRFLSNGTARQYLIAAGKTWRKHNGGIGLITQSAADLQNAGVLDLVNEICPTKILLANAGADLASYQRMFRLNEREVELFSELLPKRQFLLKSTSRAKVLNVNLDPHVKPAKQGGRTNLNLITASGNVYSFLATEVSQDPNGHADLKIFVTPSDASAGVAMKDKPRFVSADAIAEYKQQAQDARAQLAAEQKKGQLQLEQEKAALRAEYPETIKHDYKYSVSQKNPFHVTAIYHDDRFTYIEARPEEAPSVYEVKDGKPSLIPYQFKDGRYTIPKILDEGYLRVGKSELKFHREN